MRCRPGCAAATRRISAASLSPHVSMPSNVFSRSLQWLTTSSVADGSRCSASSAEMACGRCGLGGRRGGGAWGRRSRRARGDPASSRAAFGVEAVRPPQGGNVGRQASGQAAARHAHSMRRLQRRSVYFSRLSTHSPVVPRAKQPVHHHDQVLWGAGGGRAAGGSGGCRLDHRGRVGGGGGLARGRRNCGTPPGRAQHGRSNALQPAHRAGRPQAVGGRRRECPPHDSGRCRARRRPRVWGQHAGW